MAKKKKSNNNVVTYGDYKKKSGSTISYGQYKQLNEQNKRKKKLLNDFTDSLRVRKEQEEQRKRDMTTFTKDELVDHSRIIKQARGQQLHQQDNLRKEYEHQAATKYWQDTAKEYTHTNKGDQRGQVYAAKMMNDTPGALEREQQRQYEQLKKYLKDLNSRKMQAGSQGYNEFKEEKKEQEGYRFGVRPFTESQNEKQEKINSGFYNPGTDPYFMNDEGLANYIEQNRKASEEAKTRPMSSRSDQMADIYDSLLSFDRSNAMDQIDREMVRKAQLNSNQERQSVYNNASEYFSTDLDTLQRLYLNSDSDAQRDEMRREIFDEIMPVSYDEWTSRLTADQISVLDKKLDQAIRGEGATVWQETQASKMYAQNAKEAEDIQQFRRDYQKMSDWAAQETQFSPGYDPSYVQTVKEMDNFWSELYDVPVGSEVDKAYYYAHNLPEPGSPLNNIDHASKYYFMTPKMLEEFEILYQQQKAYGGNRADMFLKGIDTYLQHCLSVYQDYYIRSKAEEPVAGTAMRIMSPAINAAGSVAGLTGIGMAGLAGLGAPGIGDEEAGNPNSNYYLANKIVRTMREQQNKDVAQLVGDESGTVEFLMNVGDSISDNLLAMGIGGFAPAGAASKPGMRIIQAVMSSEAATNTMLNKLEQNYEPTEAAVYAIGDGAIEWITERVTLERILKADFRNMGFKEFLKYLGGAGLAEGSEEVNADLLNWGLDSVMSMINDHEDELQRRYRELINNGMGETEATRQVIREKWMQIGSSYMAGMLSGIGMAVGHSAAQGVNIANVGRNINNNSNIENLTNAAALMKEGTESYDLGQKLQDKLKSGKKISNYEAGRLALNIINETNEEIGNTARSVLEDRIFDDLQNKDVDRETARDMSRLIVKAIVNDGIDNLSEAERRAINNNPAALNTYMDYRFNEETQQKANEAIKESAPNERGAKSVAEQMLSRPQSRNRSRGAQLTGRYTINENDTDYSTAEGEKVEGPRGIVVYDNGTVQHARLDSFVIDDENGGKLKYRVTVNGETKLVDPGQIRTTNAGMAAIIESQVVNPTFYSQAYVNQMIYDMAEPGVQNQLGNYMIDASLIRYAAFQQSTMPQTRISPEIAQRLYSMAQSELRSIRENETTEAKRNAHKPGEGKATFKDVAKFGTQEFDDAINKLNISEEQKEKIKAQAAVFVAAGVDVKFVDNAYLEELAKKRKDLAQYKGKMSQIYGEESSSGILINIEGKNYSRNFVTGKLIEKGVHDITVTSGHEFLHWLRENSSIEAYDNVAKYVLDTQRKTLGTKGLNEAIAEYMDRQGLTLDRAIDEYIADSCDSIFSNETVLDHIQKTNKTLFGQIKSFVQDMFNRVRTALTKMYPSMSRASRNMINTDMRKLGELVNVAWDEAVSRPAQKQETAPAEDVRRNSMAVVENISGMTMTQLNSAYMDAVKNGDMVTAKKLVAEAAKRAGYTVKAYHGTDNFGFTEFNMEKSQNQIFVAYDIDVSASYLRTERSYTYQPRALNTYAFDPTDTTNDELAEYIKNNGIEDIVPEEIESVTFNKNTNQFDVQTTNAEELPFGDGIISYTREAIYDLVEGRLGSNGIYELFTKPGKQLVVDAKGSDWNKIDYSGRGDYLWRTREIAEVAAEEGYDSVRINNVEDYGGKGMAYGFGDIGIFFNPKDVKSADAVVYDNNGEVIPLDERFDDSKTDIRWSKAQLDEQYNKALKINDEAEMQRLVDEAAEYAMPESKVRDADGKLLKMYHGTKADFTVFLREYIGSTGRFEGSGFNFTPYQGRAASYGSKVLAGYLNITNPLSSEKKTMSVRQLAEIIRKADPTGDYIIADYARNTNDYGSDSFVRRESMTTARSVWDYADNDVDIYSAISAANSDAKSWINVFEEMGYDGLIHYDDNGNIKTAVAFNSNQFKSAEPVTYDNGKPIVLSKRFNLNEPDIRWSKAQTETNKNNEGRAGLIVDDIDKMRKSGKPSSRYIITDEADAVNTDREYEEAVERGDLKTATRLLMNKLKETDGAIPFIAPNWDTGEYRETARQLKAANPEAIAKAADQMAEYVPDNAVLIPMPGRTGKVTSESWAYKLADAISERTGRPVVIALEGAERESRYEAKRADQKGASQEELGFKQVKDIPEGMFPIFIDNVVGSGVTADAARQAIGGGITLAYTKTLRSPGIVGLKNAMVTYESKAKGGALIPLSERFDLSKRDVRYSKWTEQGMDVNYWMEHATPGMVQTEDERALIDAYRGKRISMSLSLKKQSDYKAKIRQLEAKAELTTEQRSELTALRNRLEIEQNKFARLEDEIFRITRTDGWAGAMYQHNMVFRDYIEGKTQDQVRKTVEAMLKQVEETQEQIRKDTESLKKLAETQAVKAMKSYMGKSSLGRMASMLRNYYNTTMGKAEISDRLAEMALKLANKRDITADTETLARDLISRVRGIKTDALQYLNGTTLNIGESLLKEYIAENRINEDVNRSKKDTDESFQKKVEKAALKKIAREIKGSGVTIIAEGKYSRLQEQWKDLRENNNALEDIDGLNPSNALNSIIDYLANQVEDSLGINQNKFDIDDVSLFVRSAVGNVTTYLTDNPAARKQIDSLMKQIEELSSRTEKTAEDMEALNAKLDEVIQAGQRAKGMTTVLERDVNEAIKYYNTTARVAAENERNKVRQNLIKQLRSETAQKLLQQQEKFREQMKNDREARQLQEDNIAARRKISTVATRMANRIFAETDRENIPEETKALARKVLDMISEHDDFFRKVTFWDGQKVDNVRERLARMKGVYGAFDPDTDLDWLIQNPGPDEDDTAFVRVVQDLINIESGLLDYRNAEGRGRVSLQDRKAALTKVQEALSEIWSVIQARGQAIIEGRMWQIYDLAELMREDFENSRFKGERKGFGRSARNMASGMLNWGNLTPEYFIKNLHNRAMDILHDGLAEGENRNGLEAAEARQRVAEIAQRTGFATWDGQEKHQVKTRSGEITMTTEQIMALYATWLREQNQMRPQETAHLLHGGFVLAENDQNKGKPGREKKNVRPIRISEAQLNALGQHLTDTQKEYVRAIVDYMSGELAELGNEASMRMYGIKKFTEQYYFPIRSWGGVLNQRSDAGVKNNNENRAAQQGFSKRVKNNANNAIEISDFTPTAIKHVVGMINYNTVAPAIENLNKVLNQQLTYGEIREDENGEELDDTYKQNMRAAFRVAYGNQAADYLATFMKDLNGGVTTERTAFDKLLSVFKKNAVAGSLSVAAQQPLSYIRAAMLVDAKYLAAAINPAYWNGSYAEMMKWSGLAVIKEMGKFDMNFGQTMQDWIMPDGYESKAKKVWTGVTDAMTALPQKMDAMTWTRMWTAVKLEQMAQNKGMDFTSDEFMQKVASRFNELMRKTQVYDSVMTKSQNMRSKDWKMKSITSFMAEPTLSLNVLADAWQNIGSAGGKRKAVRALVTFLLSAAAQAGVKGFFGTGRSPDKKKNREENFLNKFLANLISEINPFGLIPGYRSMIDLLTDGEVTDDAMGMIGKAIEVYDKTIDMITNWNFSYRNFEDSIGQLLQLTTKVPLKNLMRDFRAMANFFSNGNLEAVTGNTYAKRPTDPDVLKYSLLDTLVKEDLAAVINKRLGEAGYGTDNTDYYKRIYEAEKAGDQQAADSMRKYLENGKGVKPDTITDGVRKEIKKDSSASYSDRIKSLRKSGSKDSDIAEWIVKEFNDGKIKRTDAEKLWREADPSKDANDAYFKFEQQEWEKTTGQNITDTEWFKLNDAIEKGDTAAYQAAKKDMIAHGYEEKDIDDKAKSQVTKMYKEGKLTRQQAEGQLKQYRKDLTDDDIWWTLDRIDYKNETGKDAGSGQYYRLNDAIEANKSAEINNAVSLMLKHGKKKEDIKKNITSTYKKAYLAAKGAEKTKLMDALTKAYKAVGLTGQEAIDLINSWKTK